MQSAVKTTSEETVKVRIEQMLHEMMEPVGVKLCVGLWFSVSWWSRGAVWRAWRLR